MLPAAKDSLSSNGGIFVGRDPSQCLVSLGLQGGITMVTGFDEGRNCAEGVRAPSFPSDAAATQRTWRFLSFSALHNAGIAGIACASRSPRTDALISRIFGIFAP